MNTGTSIALGLVLAAVPATGASAGFIGTTVDFCTDSTFSGSVASLNPADCDSGAVSVEGDDVLIDGSTEIQLAGGRDIDIGDTTIDILWSYTGASTSPDLFVLSELASFNSLTLVGSNLIDVDFVFDGAAGAIGFLVRNPTAGQTTVSFLVDNAQDVPAPGALALFGLGAFGLGIRRRHR